MENDKQTPEVELDENEIDDVEEGQGQPDDKDWKAEALKYKAILERNKNKKEKPSTKSSTKSDELDYGQKAFLATQGISGSDETEFTKKMLKETGKSLDGLLESTYFQTELKSFREQKATQNAVPNSNNRSSNSAIDTVEYWIAKGELPPKSDVDLRRKVIDARMKSEKTSGQFYNS